MPHYPIHSIASAPENPKPTLEQLQQTFGESGAPHVFGAFLALTWVAGMAWNNANPDVFVY
jgi:hypothetical protein